MPNFPFSLPAVLISSVTTTLPIPVSAQVLHPNPFTSSNSNYTTHDIGVGRSGLKFSPAILYAAPGDTLNFHFWPSNHSVVQSAGVADLGSGGPSNDATVTPLNVCQPLGGGSSRTPIYSGQFAGRAPTGSGANAVAATADDGMWSMTLNTSDPVWLYSSGRSDSDMKDDCKEGMVMVINPPVGTDASSILLSYISAAKEMNGPSGSPDQVFGGHALRDNGASATGNETIVTLGTDTGAATAKKSSAWTRFDRGLKSTTWFFLGSATLLLAAL